MELNEDKKIQEEWKIFKSNGWDYNNFEKLDQAQYLLSFLEAAIIRHPKNMKFKNMKLQVEDFIQCAIETE